MTLSNSGESNIDILIEQVGRLTEGLTEFKTEMLVRFDQLTQIAER
jgi:hypothetical protein